MTVDKDVTEFRRSLRGYDPDDVERTLTELRAQLEQSEFERQEQARLVRNLSRDLAEAQERAARIKPNFTELGVAFEETLRVAEEQASKMVSEARAEAENLTARAAAECAELRERADKDAAAWRGEAQRYSDQLRFDAETESAQLLQQAADDAAKAKAALERASHRADQITSKAEREAADRLAEAVRQAEEVRRSAAEVLSEANQQLADAKSEIRRLAAEAERSRAAVISEADAYAQRAYASAEAHVAEAAERAGIVTAEANVIIERARERARVESEQAQMHASRVVREALARAHALSADTDDMLRSIMSEAEIHMSDARRQMVALGEFMQRMRVIAADADNIRVDLRETGRQTRATQLSLSPSQGATGAPM